MKNIKIYIIATFLLLAVAILPHSVLACSSSSSSTSSGYLPGQSSALTLQNPLCYNSIQDLINAVLSLVAGIGAIVAVLMFIYAGFLYISAQGSEDGVKKAHAVFRNAVIGTAILLSATLIATIIETTINTIQTKSGLPTSEVPAGQSINSIS